MNVLAAFRQMFRSVPTGNRLPSGKRPRVRRSFPLELETLEDRCLPSTVGASAITGNFNGTAIPAGSPVWFSSAFKVNGLPNAGATFNFTNDTITFTANGQTTTVNAPNAEVTLYPAPPRRQQPSTHRPILG